MYLYYLKEAWQTPQSVYLHSAPITVLILPYHRLPVCMNTSVSETIRARATKDDSNIYVL